MHGQDGWCYARGTRWAYQADLMCYRNLDTGICTQYDMDKDAFVEGQLEGEGYDAKFVAF
jgi:hypothetical protein